MSRLPAPQSDEKELLVELQHYDAARSRLSCQVEFTDALDGLPLTVRSGRMNGAAGIEFLHSPSRGGEPRTGVA